MGISNENTDKKSRTTNKNDKTNERTLEYVGTKRKKATLVKMRLQLEERT